MFRPSPAWEATVNSARAYFPSLSIETLKDRMDRNLLCLPSGTSSRFPHADDTQIVYHSQHTLGDAGAVSQEKKRDESFQSFQACKEGLFRPCLKTFVAPFLPARLSLRGWTRRGLKNVCVGRFEVTDRK